MSTDSADDEGLDKTNIFELDTTAKVKVDPNSKPPPCLVMLVGPAVLTGRQWPLINATTIFGRHYQSDVQISEQSMSKAHARFETNEGRVNLIDLGSTNGTFVNGKQIAAHTPHLLKNDDQVMLGSAVFKFLERGILSETAEKSRMQNELQTARLVQENLFPAQSEAAYDWVQVSGRYRSASECGGDWWWHWSCGGRVFALIGDATGHGAGAALLTSAARSAVASIEDDPNVRINRVFSAISSAIRKCSGGKIMMSAFIIEIDLATRKVFYVNASHIPSVYISKAAETYDWRSLRNIQDPISKMLGASDTCMIGELKIEPTSRLLLLTDGLAERKGVRGTRIRERQFGNMLIESHRSNLDSPKNFLDSLLRESDKVAESDTNDDDITVVAIDFA